MKALQYWYKLAPLFDKSRIVLISLFLTRACNLRCQHCFYYEGQADQPQEGELSFTELQKLATALPPFPWLILTGGEPFLRGDLIDITALFSQSKGISNITIPTNGLLFKRMEEWVKAVKTFNPCVQFNLNFSLYGFAEDHDRITSVEGSWQKTMEHAKALMPLMAEVPNLRMVFSMSLMKENQHCMLQAVQALRQQFPAVRINLGVVRGEPRDNGQLDIQPQRYREIARFIDEHPYLDQQSSFLERFFATRDALMHQRIYEELSGSGKYRPCLAGRLSLVISEQGKVYLCELIPKPIGDLRIVDFHFSTIYNSAKRKELLREIAENRCSCTHECNQTVNLLYDFQLFRQTLRYFILRSLRS